MYLGCKSRIGQACTLMVKVEGNKSCQSRRRMQTYCLMGIDATGRFTPGGKMRWRQWSCVTSQAQGDVDLRSI